MTDFITALKRLAPRKRLRFSRALFGAAFDTPAPEFLDALSAELAGVGDPSPYLTPAFFAVETELDTLYAAAVAATLESESEVLNDRHGMMEMDGMCLDAVFAYSTGGGAYELVMAYARLNGKWSGRRFRRLTDRLRRVFGEDGSAFPRIRPRFVAFGPSRPTHTQTDTWPAWMRSADGSSLWLPYGKDPDELAIVRCDRKGRPRRIGEYWKLSRALKKSAKA